MTSQLVTDSHYLCVLLFLMGLILGIIIGALITESHEHHPERRRK